MSPMKVYVSPRESPNGKQLVPGDSVPKGIDEYGRDTSAEGYDASSTPTGVGHESMPSKGQTREPVTLVGESGATVTAATEADAKAALADAEASGPVSTKSTSK